MIVSRTTSTAEMKRSFEELAAHLGRALAFPEGVEVWSLLVHPTNHRILYAGTSPVGVWRSDDGGGPHRASS